MTRNDPRRHRGRARRVQEARAQHSRIIARHVGHQQCVCRTRREQTCEPTAFQRGQPGTRCVDRADVETGTQRLVIERLQLLERHARRKALDQARGTARDETEHLAASRQGTDMVVQDVACSERTRVRYRVRRLNDAHTRQLSELLRYVAGLGDHEGTAHPVAEYISRAERHGTGRLAEGDDMPVAGERLPLQLVHHAAPGVDGVEGRPQTVQQGTVAGRNQDPPTAFRDPRPAARRSSWPGRSVPFRAARDTPA
jgi:hypothetical protein